MGCGASKGKEAGASTEDAKIEFKDTGCHSMDEFFSRAKKILKALADITEPLNDQKEKFFEVTGFYEVPGAGK